MSPILILASGIAGVLIGMAWYNPKVFGTAWMRMANITPEQAEKGQKRMPLMAFIGFLAATFMAWVLSVVLQTFGAYDWLSAADVAFWIWAGFVAPILLGSFLWETKPFTLYLINASYWLVTLLAMSVILVQ
ncbi:MAG: hypothetical protein RLZZ342_494 [Candidatus Parcubacteria bacterium]|jgi:hypothetical protein